MVCECVGYCQKLICRHLSFLLQQGHTRLVRDLRIFLCVHGFMSSSPVSRESQLRRLVLPPVSYQGSSHQDSRSRVYIQRKITRGVILYVPFGSTCMARHSPQDTILKRCRYGQHRPDHHAQLGHHTSGGLVVHRRHGAVHLWYHQ